MTNESPLKLTSTKITYFVILLLAIVWCATFGVIGMYIQCREKCVCAIRPVKGIHVNCTGLQARAIPAGIINNATEIDLSKNMLAGLKNKSFIEMFKLKTLRLDFNRISNIEANAFEGLVILITLSLGNNLIRSEGLTDFIFSPLSSLNTLDLGACKLNSINVKSFVNLSNLERLYLSKNKLQIIREFIYRNESVLPNLIKLFVVDALIPSVSSFNSKSFPSLKEIYFSGNLISLLFSNTSRLLYEYSHRFNTKINTNMSDSLRNLNVSKSLNSWSNYLRKEKYQSNVGLIDPHPIAENGACFVTFNQITLLDLSRNRLTKLSSNYFVTMTSLQSLHLANNSISHIDVSAFVGLHRLIYLGLQGNPITIFADFVFSSCVALQTLDLSNTGITTPVNVQAFRNLSNLTKLMLENNKLVDIPQFYNGNVSVVPKLKTLGLLKNSIISTNSNKVISIENIIEREFRIFDLDLKSNGLRNLTRNGFALFTVLKKLSLAKNEIRIVDIGAFSGLNYLEQLDLSDNPLHHLPDFAFSSLVSLKSLDMSNNDIDILNVRSLINLTHLRELRLQNNYIPDIPHFIYQRNSSILPNLIYLSMISNKNQFSDSGNVSRRLKSRGSILAGIRSMPKLEILAMENKKVTLLNGTFEHLLHFDRLDLARCKISITDFAMKSNSLTHISLNSSSISSLSRNAFGNAHRLKTLYMPNVRFDTKNPKQFMLSNFLNLETVDLSYTEIVPESSMFTNSTNIKYLNLNGNPLKQLNKSVFSNLTSLRSLHLRSTGISSVNFTSLPEQYWTQLEEIDLSENPFICHCGIVWFRRWLQKTNVTILNSYGYICAYPEKYKDKRIETLTEPSRIECFTPPDDWCFLTIILFLICIGLLTLIISLLHHFRWHVRYWQCVVKARHHQYMDMRDLHEYTYDAFVMYSQSDSQWVIHELRQQLEVDDDLRLCIHHRDWLGGQDITDNIVQSIEESRKCLLIVSNAFAASHWCHVEMTMAQSRLFESDRDNLVLVVLEEIAERHMTPRLRLQMQRQTYIEWTDNAIGQHVFWTQLKRALRRADHSLVNSPLSQSMFFGHAYTAINDV